MNALFLNCTRKPSPQESDTDRPASVVAEALEAEGVDVSTIHVVDHDVRPGVTSDEGDGDEWPAIRDRILEAAMLTVPGQAWTYWNMGPGPGPSYGDTDHGHEWSHTTGRAAAQNLLAPARALAAPPIPAPPS